MAEAWEQLAWANQIYPLDEGSSIKYLVRPERSAVYGEPVTIRRGTPTLERWRSVQLIWFRSLTIRRRSRPPRRRSGDARRARRPGRGLRALRPRRRALLRAQRRPRRDARRSPAGPMADGVREVVADLAAVGGRLWDLTLSVDGEVRATEPGVPMLFGIAPFEGIDVGIDRRSPVSLGHLRAVRPVPVHRHARRRHVHARRARPRRPGEPDGHVAGAGRWRTSRSPGRSRSSPFGGSRLVSWCRAVVSDPPLWRPRVEAACEGRHRRRRHPRAHDRRHVRHDVRGRRWRPRRAAGGHRPPVLRLQDRRRPAGRDQPGDRRLVG